MKPSIAPDVARALSEDRPVVALESTVITHGLPRPRNLELARLLEAEIRDAGAVPATIAILAGRPVVGIADEQLEELASGGSEKASLWNLAAVVAARANAGTTVAATLALAATVGIRVFATGGIGGVHPQPFDESADLPALARYPVVTVCSGPKSILRADATLERLETLGVPVVGYRSDRLAGFHVPHTDLKVASRAEDAEQLARIFLAHEELGMGGGMLVSNPVSTGLERESLGEWLRVAEAEATGAGFRGRETTPYMLARLAELSGGRTVDVNIRLLRENARLAAETAVELSRLRGGALLGVSND